MRTVGYLFGGYMILSFSALGLTAGGPTGFLALVLAVGAMAMLVRSYRRGRNPVAAPMQPGLGSATPDVRALIRRLERRSAELAARLPADPFASDAFVAVRYALMHEPDETRVGAESEYMSRHGELETVQTTTGRLADDWREDALTGAEAAAEARRLDERLSDVEAYADGLDVRARESAEAADRARGSIDRAEALLGSAPSSVDSAAVRRTLGEAAAALEPGRERPLTARRLADDALHRLELAADRDESERALPGDVHERQTAVAERQATVAEVLARVRENLALAASRSARTCVVDIEAGEAAARQLHEQTARAAVAAADRVGAGDLGGAAEQLATALALLDQAEPLVERVEAQLADLARTALAAREEVRRAETATDAAWVALEQAAPPGGETGRLEVVREARRLAERARAALGEQKPDWFEIRELSERATRIAQAVEPALGRAEDAGHSELDAARDAATAARDEAWAQALSDYADGARVHDAEAVYQQALRLEAEAAVAPSAAATARAVGAFRQAERIARSAAIEAEDARIRARPQPGRGADPTELVAATALGALLGAAFDD